MFVIMFQITYFKIWGKKKNIIVNLICVWVIVVVVVVFFFFFFFKVMKWILFYFEKKEREREREREKRTKRWTSERKRKKNIILINYEWRCTFFESKNTYWFTNINFMRLYTVFSSYLCIVWVFFFEKIMKTSLNAYYPIS